MKTLKNVCLLALMTLILSSCGGDGFTYVKVSTDLGDMRFKLYNSTPKHRDNFIKLTKDGYYDGLLFHRIISGFMAQGGDPNSRGAAEGVPLGTGGPGYKVDAEIGAPHFKGTLAAARQGGPGNPLKQSSGSQFYIVQGTVQSDQQIDSSQARKGITYTPDQRERYKTMGGTMMLDMDYTVFGEIVEGMEVIDKLCAVQTAPGDRPLKDIKMTVTID